MADGAINHPYFPRDTHLPHYKPNITSIEELLGLFFGLVAVLNVLLWLGTRGRCLGVRVKVCWFVTCGLIHSILEGYFSLYHRTLAGEDTYLAQMWKEYGQGDSRYVSGETCMVAMESITAWVDGPLCLLTATAFLVPGMSGWRYVLQLAVSICQLYGDTLYFSTEILENFRHSEYGHPLHFWFYFFFLNMIWIVVPSLNIFDAVRKLVAVQRHVDSTNKSSGKPSKKRR
ncbi:3-beta-hydroxysteroid-Delta(8),Delta(7)-isomerase-like [Mya arenaria]|uniref:3-beta-hydroxysteroid-Delta(8), Delta(7)-isomerase-like n=1 Tax=Mya arenaria TaxID=6604 RepID=UPI0022E7B5A5|nr:3-beta-hydroxysteroid-Delta(8),Delta(7)-isomerase-like [Mya arenaria]